MSFIESIKAHVIGLADQINKASDPFPAFDRACFAPYPQRTLRDMEREFYADLVNKFWGCDGRVLLHRLPLPTGSPLDTGDQAIWHGVYTAMLALRYNVLSRSEPTSQDFQESTETYSHLVEASKGLQLHQTVHGEARPRLVRGVQDDGKTYQDDASNDSATGHLLGIYFGWKFGPETMRPVFAQLAAGLAAELHNNRDCLVGPEGKPTSYGALEQGWKTDPLRITLALAIYAVGATLTHEKEFIGDYERLFRKYKSLIPYPKVRLWLQLPFKQVILDNQNDTHRAAIHLAILADLTQGDPQRLCLDGINRLRAMTIKEGNVWVDALCLWAEQETWPYPREVALKVLREVTLKSLQSNEGRQNYPKLPSFGDPVTGQNWSPKAVKWGDKYVADQPIPLFAMRAQDFPWQRNRRSFDIGSAGAAPDSILNGGWWLCAYWLARENGTLRAND